MFTRDQISKIAAVEIILPSIIYAIEGKETNIYWSNIITSNVREIQLDFDVTCSKGAQYEKCFRITPVSSDAGTYSWTLDVYYAGVKIATASTTLYISAASSGSGVSRNVIAIGDSTLSGGQPLSIIISEHSADVMTLAFKGTQGIGANMHEGRAGWKISNFASNTGIYYKYNLTGVVTPPAVTDVYSDGTNQWTVREINLTSGTGYISTDRSVGNGTSAASGTLSRVVGTGDAILNYTSWATTPSNPFWNVDHLDFAHYLSVNSISINANDWIVIHLGINDVFYATDEASLKTLLDQMVSDLRTLMSNFRTAVPNIRVAICMTIPPTISQDGFGANYTTGQPLFKYLVNLKGWQKRIIAEFDKSTERTAGNYIIPYYAVIDRANNYKMAQVAANSRNSSLITTFTNGVHPDQTGYDQLGDQLWAFLKYMV